MFSEQETVTDQLVSVIRYIQLKRGSGTLSAMRGGEATSESGTIVFVQGKVMQAKAGRYHDRDALNWLSTWSTCRVAFVPAAGSEDLPLQLAPGLSTSNTCIPPHVPGSIPREADLFRMLGPITPVPGNEAGNLNTPTSAPALSQIIPRRSKPPDVALYLMKLKGLSRSHRRLFLLIDGVHDLIELANLLNRDQFDTLVLLYDLQEANCIIIPSSHKSSK
jgi:hypothetical protein